MLNIKNLCLILISVLFGSASVLATKSNSYDIAPSLNKEISPHMLAIELEPVLRKTYKTAALTFLPDIVDSDIGFGDRNLKDNHNSMENCKDYTLKTCPAKGVCTKCPFEMSYYLTGCNDGFKKSGNSCVPNSCQAINSGYQSSVPVNQYCTKVTEYGLTCYKDCKNVSCGSFPVKCDVLAANMSGLFVSGYRTCDSCMDTGD